jgi:hypothetical protein
MTVERVIHLAMFILILVGLCGISAWASYTYIYLTQDNVVLAVAGIALSWGVILSVLYLGFRQLDWDWWS